MNIGYETEIIEFKKSTGEMKEGIISIRLSSKFMIICHLSRRLLRKKLLMNLV